MHECFCFHLQNTHDAFSFKSDVDILMEAKSPEAIERRSIGANRDLLKCCDRGEHLPRAQGSCLEFRGWVARSTRPVDLWPARFSTSPLTWLWTKYSRVLTKSIYHKCKSAKEHRSLFQTVSGLAAFDCTL